MIVNSFTYWKNKGSYADVLAANGLAHLIYLLTGKYPMIEDKQSYFLISSLEDIDLDKLPYDQLIKDPGYEEIDDVKYEELSKQVEYYWTRRKNSKNLTEEEKLLLEQEKPRNDWTLIHSLKILQALNSYNSLFQQILNADNTKFTETIKIKLSGYATMKLSEEVESKISLKVSPIQAFNPSIGKGVNRTKPDGASIASFPKSMMDWFEEYLRFLGVKSTLQSYKLDKDIKLMAIVPGKINYGKLSTDVMERLRSKENIGRTSIRVDTMTVLAISVILLEQIDIVKDHKINQIIHGIQIAYFKDMGQVKALINQSFLRLPGWFYINNNDDADDMRYIIEEHMACIRWLDEKKSEDAALLHVYRDGLSGDNIKKIYEFMAGYGIFVMRNLNKKNTKIARLSEDGLRRLVMKGYPLYREIVENIGFQNIAKAIRNATVNEQYAKSRGQQTYEIHYDLFPTLKRNATFPDKFLSSLLDFVSQYNKETARKIEQKGKNNNINIKRALVSTQDIEDFVQIFDKYPQQSETIAMLLIAYASSKTTRKANEQQEESEDNDVIIYDEQEG